MLLRIVMVSIVVLVVSSNGISAESRRPVYLWLEPEWFSGVEGNFEYGSGPESVAEVHSRWSVAGPGVSAEWTQGGESESNSIAAGPRETNALCQREIVVPRDGTYRVWVRYYDHRLATEPFGVRVEQDGKTPVTGDLGIEAVVHTAEIADIR